VRPGVSQDAARRRSGSPSEAPKPASSLGLASALLRRAMRSAPYDLPIGVLRRACRFSDLASRALRDDAAARRYTPTHGERRNARARRLTPILDDLARRHADACAMGGPERRARQHAAGRLDARQRTPRCSIPALRSSQLAAGRVGFPAPGRRYFVAGAGQIDGRDVVVGAEDFTVLGGSIGIRAHAKRRRVAGASRCRTAWSVGAVARRRWRARENAFERYPARRTIRRMLARLSGPVPTVVVVP
jgi:hypothetical protein